jgi:lysophospholipase L1-like esterase
MKPGTRAYAGFLAVLVLLIAGVELAARAIEPSSELLQYVFRSRMNLARWSFLSSRQDRLQIDLAEPELHPHQDGIVQPEPDRPAFDRISQPYYVRTNSHGFRDREFRDAPDPDRPLVLVLGDSVTYGKGVEREARFSQILQQRLPAGHDVYNLGVQGCSSRCMAMILDRFLFLDPRLVVLQASMNDFDLMLWRQAESRDLSGPGLFALRVLTASRALLAMSYQVNGDPHDRQMAQASEAARAQYGQDIRRMLDRCRDAGVQVMVLAVPYATGSTPQHPLAEACRARPDACVGVVDVKFPANGPGHAIPPWVRDTAMELGFHPEAVAGLFPLGRYFHDVVHPDARGNQVIADRLFAFIPGFQ